MTSPISAVRALPRFAYLSPAEAREVVLAVLGAVREPSDAVLRAAYTATHSPRDTPAGGFTRWATYEEACEMDGWREERAQSYRAAIDALIAEVLGTMEEAAAADLHPHGRRA